MFAFSLDKDSDTAVFTTFIISVFIAFCISSTAMLIESVSVLTFVKLESNIDFNVCISEHNSLISASSNISRSSCLF